MACATQYFTHILAVYCLFGPDLNNLNIFTHITFILVNMAY